MPDPMAIESTPDAPEPGFDTEPAFRPAQVADLPTCAAIWREAVNDYTRKLNQPDAPEDLNRLVGLYEHTRATDPDRFVVAVRPDPGAPGGERVVAFGSAVVREPLWYLSMLFVLPEEQGRGLGRRLFEHLLPPPEAGLARAIGADSAQPISNALYASHGIVPQVPVWYLTGSPRRPDAFPDLPPGVTASAFDAMAAGPPDGPGHRKLVATIGALDREIAGFEHPQDHRDLRADRRTGYLYRGSDGQALGYGYVAASGRIGPIAVRDAELLPGVIGHLIGSIEPKGAYAIWVGGPADRALPNLLRAGFRIEGFPVLLLWDRPFADFRRYLPISPGLL
jgi:GNAT superfamily N-acetyltransferase